MKQTVIRPTGIVRQPNEYSEVASGTLKVGDGIQIRRSSVIEPRNAFETWSSIPGSFPGADQAVKLFPYEGDNALAVIRNNGGASESLYVLDGFTAETVGFLGPPSFSFSPGKTFATRARGRSIITNDTTPAILNIPVPPVYVARQAGFAPPFISDINTTTGGSIWETAKYLGYAAVFRRTDSDGYVVRGAVSTKLIARNAAGADRLATVRVAWPSDFAYLRAGDVVELYRLPQQDSADLLGDEYRLAVEHELSSAEVTAGFVDILDTCLETGLSTYMYTNPSQKGSDKTFMMPPASSDVCTFKKATFYNTTSLWHQVVARIPNKWGALSTADEIEHGIGSRSTTGTFTNGQSTFTIGSATGIKIGQIIRSTVPGVDNTTITNVAGTTITFSGTAGASIVGSSISVYDTISIDGVSLDAHYPESLVNALGAAMIAGTVQTSMYASPTLDLSQVSVSGAVLTFINAVPPDSFTIKATNGANYSPPLAEFSGTAQTSTNDPRTNRVHFSEIDQPENVPPANFLLVGSGTILKLWATQDSLFAFCTDGIFRIDGDGDDWSVKPFDPDTILLAPDAVDSMDNTIYALTTAGLVSFSDSGGIRKLSAPLIGEDIRTLWTQFQDADTPLPYTWNVQLACDKYRSEVWLNFNDIDDDVFGQTWIWNVDTNTFVTQSEVETTTVFYLDYLRTMILSAGTTLRQYNDEAWMPTDVEFNSVYAEDLGLLKQWIDVTLFFEDLTEDSRFTPRFEGSDYPSYYEIAETAGAFDHVVAPLLTAVCSKHMRFGYLLESDSESATPYYRLKGLTYRYRIAAEPLRQ